MDAPQGVERQYQVLERLTVAVAITGFAGLVGIVLLTVVDVGLKDLGGQRLPGFDDYGQLLFPIIIASCFPVGLLQRRSVTITFLGMGLGPPVNRVLTLFGAILTLVFFVLVAWRFIFMTIDFGQSGAVTSTVLMPVTPTWWLATALFWLAVPMQAWVCWVRLREVIEGRYLLSSVHET
jgi:TRAP-type C4-dicarboxylate transport system permease small subunit